MEESSLHTCLKVQQVPGQWSWGQVLGLVGLRKQHGQSFEKRNIRVSDDRPGKRARIEDAVMEGTRVRNMARAKAESNAKAKAEAHNRRQ
eukprot:15020580-Heterocapsa_arctica.AAC.1